jgi:CBS domain-containing protein
MEVQELMTREVKACAPETNLAAAAMMRWEGDCGTLPVVGEGGQVVGMITDRDICMAAATKHRPASEIAAGEVITGQLFACAPETDVRAALETMRQNRVRRLPVVDGEGRLQGVVSMNDVVLKAQKAKNGKAADITFDDVVNTFKAICAHLTQEQSEEPPREQAATA